MIERMRPFKGGTIKLFSPYRKPIKIPTFKDLEFLTLSNSRDPENIALLQQQSAFWPKQVPLLYPTSVCILANWRLAGIGPEFFLYSTVKDKLIFYTRAALDKFFTFPDWEKLKKEQRAKGGRLCG